jgi:peptidoglycan hydrolase-like protein with peptidoglycan-binding domain
MRNLVLVFFSLWMANTLWADDFDRAVQQRLKDQGFYYGEVNGQRGEETSAAIRRYQIRRGLKVTGQLNDETLHSLGISPKSAVQPTPGNQENGGPPGAQPNNRYYRQPTGQYDEDRSFLQPQSPEDYNEMQRGPATVPEVVNSFPRLFAGTLYERSPAQIQENVLYAIQGELMRRGLFRGVIDGRPGPATSDAILRLQQDEGLPESGRLDNETLNELGAFPGQRNGPPEEGLWQRPGRHRSYRNIPDPF